VPCDTGGIFSFRVAASDKSNGVDMTGGRHACCLRLGAGGRAEIDRTWCRVVRLVSYKNDSDPAMATNKILKSDHRRQT